MNKIYKWLHGQRESLEQADKTRGVQAGGVVEPPEETAIDRLVREKKRGMLFMQPGTSAFERCNE